MFLAFHFILMIWCWYQYGLVPTAILAALTSIVYLWRHRKLFAVFLFGSVLIVMHLEMQLRHILPRSMQHEEVQLTVCAEQKPKVFGSDVVTAYAKVVEQPTTLQLRRIKFSIYEPLLETTPHQPGLCYQGTFRLRQPLGRLIPGAFDSDRYYFSHHVDALAIMTELDHYQSQPSFAQMLYLQQQPRFDNDDALAAWAALSLGWSNSLPSELKSLFASNQLMHLFVISGMHIGFIAGMLVSFFLLISRLAYRFVLISRTVQGIACLALLLTYVAMLGFPVPATRALVMFALPIYGWISGSRLSITKTLTLTFLLLTAWQPECWLLLGTWLSFISAVLLLMITQWPPIRRLAWYWQTLLIQIILSLSVIPWALLAGLSVNPLAIIINLLVTPVIALFLLPLALLIMLIPIAHGQVLFCWIALKLIALLGWSSQFGMVLPTAGWLTVVACCTLFISTVWATRRTAVLMTLTVVCLTTVIVLSPVLSNRYRLQRFAKAKVSVLDVGHGQSILFETDQGNLLYDTGGVFSPEQSLYQVSIARMLPQLDVVVISHSDIDHSAGIADLHQQHPSVPVWAGEPERLPQSVRARNCHQASLPIPYFQFIPVPDLLQNTDNNHSCILLFQFENQTMLVTGDADRTIEYFLLQNAPDLFPVNALLLGHHGSDSSSALDWLEKNRSALFISSSGDRLKPKWPAQRIENWFEGNHRKLWNTAWSGTMTLRFSDSDINVQTMASSYRKRIQQK
jgi:competence protein ComEC